MYAFKMPPTLTGVYHLVSDDRVIYVGQTTNCFARIRSWAASSPECFDEWRFYPCSAGELNALEFEHIRRFDPPLNRRGRDMPFVGIYQRNTCQAVKEHGSVRAYLKSLRPIISGAAVKKCGLGASNREVLAIPDFPRPVSAIQVDGPNGVSLRCQWRRDDVLHWFEREAAA